MSMRKFFKRFFGDVKVGDRWKYDEDCSDNPFEAKYGFYRFTVIEKRGKYVLLQRDEAQHEKTVSTTVSGLRICYVPID
jgi:hypothetical protein